MGYVIWARVVIWIADEASNLGVRVQIPSGPLFVLFAVWSVETC